MRNAKALGIFLFILTAAVLLRQPPPARPARALSIGGQPQVQLQFRIHIPQILYLQIGQEGQAVEFIDFKVTDIPGTGKVFGDPRGIPVRVSGFVPRGQTVTLTVNSTTPLSAGRQAIPFNTISWGSTGDFPKGAFDGSASQRIGHWAGAGNRTGTYTFVYDNSRYYPPGTYSGLVTYTLSVP